MEEGDGGLLVVGTAAGLGYQIIDSRLERIQGDYSGVLSVVGLGWEVHHLSVQGLFLVQCFQDLVFSESPKGFQLFFGDVVNCHLRMLHVPVFEYHRDVLVRQLDVVQLEVDIRCRDVFDVAFAVVCAF